MNNRARLRRAARDAALALPAALLALGWFLATLRADEARREQQRRALVAGAEVVAAAVQEGLEELRAREDERPYYHYSYYFTPPDLIAVQESVAVSPLGRIPGDARVRGHFQLDPPARDGAPVATSPLLHDEAPEASRRRGRELLAALDPTLLTTLGRLTRAPGVAPATNAVNTQNAYTNAVLADIRAAQSGSSSAQVRNSFRGRAPNRARVTVDWGSLASGDPANSGLSSAAESATAAPPGCDHGAEARYTPMAFGRAGGLRYVYRVVTTECASSVQGAVLDTQVLHGRWLADVARRHAPAGVAIEVLERPAGPGRCAAQVPLAAPLEDLVVCARQAIPAGNGSLPWQLLALVFVLALIAGTTVARARALRRAERLAAVERAFVASVSHELRTPLTTLRMNAEMLQEGWVSEARRERVVRQLVGESARLSRLVEDVLTFGRLADGRASLALADGDLAARVRAVVERERERLADRGVAVTVDPPEGAVYARFDPTALDQVLTNLLDNAAKYGAPDGTGAVHVHVGRRAARALVLVRDGGPGIPPAEREQVFERFYRGPGAVASHVAGTGLGLAIVRGLCRAMGGEARVLDPGEARGCVIEVDLPGVDPETGAADSC